MFKDPANSREKPLPRWRPTERRETAGRTFQSEGPAQSFNTSPKSIGVRTSTAFTPNPICQGLFSSCACAPTVKAAAKANKVTLIFFILKNEFNYYLKFAANIVNIFIPTAILTLFFLLTILLLFYTTFCKGGIATPFFLSISLIINALLYYNHFTKAKS